MLSNSFHKKSTLMRKKKKGLVMPYKKYYQDVNIHNVVLYAWPEYTVKEDFLIMNSNNMLLDNRLCTFVLACHADIQHCFVNACL